MKESPVNILSAFFSAIESDPRIGPVHISLYATLYNLWRKNDFENPICIISHDIMPSCKISGSATYCRSIRQLHQYGYIRYQPSFNHLAGSLVYFLDMPGDRRLLSGILRKAAGF